MKQFELHYHLKEEFEARKKNNSRYSLRSFAIQLEVDPSQLSKILRAQIHLTSEMAEKILSRLSIEEVIKQQILQNITEHNLSKKEINKSSKDYYTPQSTGWPFKNKTEIAVLVAMSIPAYAKDFKGIQTSLDLSNESFESALKSLEAQELINKTETGYELVVRQISDLPNAPVNTLKTQMQKEFLQSALRSLEFTAPEKRLNGTLTLSFDENLLPQAKNKIYQFMRDFNAWTMAEARPLNSIYNMTMAFFPLKIDEELQ